MARQVKDARLDNRAARAKLPARAEPHWRLITGGRHLGYYKGARGGTWVARFRPAGEAYRKTTLGKADDTEDADGVTVLNYMQAVEHARAWFAQQLEPLDAAGPYSVADAVAAYVGFLKAERKTGIDTERRLKRNIPSKLGDRPVAELTTDELEKWKHGLVRIDPDDPDAERRSKDTANRELTMLKAALNRAFNSKKVASDIAWRRVKPFKKVARSRQVHLDAAQCTRLINSCQGAFRNLVVAALLTGARPPGELAHLRVKHFHPELRMLSIVDGKTGSREVVLTAEATRWFEEITAGRDPDALLLPRDDGTAWRRSDQMRPMWEAVARAKLPIDTCLYTLRHTHASQALLAGMNMKLLAENMGTSIKMLELNYAKFIAASRRKLIEESGFKLGLVPSNVASLSVRR